VEHLLLLLASVLAGHCAGRGKTLTMQICLLASSLQYGSSRAELVGAK
jgi:hypothetical protein